MKEAQVFVSVLMTAYNRCKYIEEAIKSVLNSTHKNFELIIVDDCSTDNTFEIAERFEQIDSRIKLYKNEINLGQFKNRNKAIELSTSDYIKFLDSDDALLPNGLELMVKAITDFPNAGIAMPVKLAYKNQLPHQLSAHESVWLHYKGENHLCYGPTATIFTKKALLHVGCFEEQFGILADTLLNLKIASSFSTVLFEKDLFFWRRHNEQVTEEQEDDVRMIKERYIIMKASLQYPETPLSKNEIDIIENNFIKINFNHFLFYLFKGQFKNAFQIKTSTNLNFTNVFIAYFKTLVK